MIWVLLYLIAVGFVWCLCAANDGPPRRSGPADDDEAPPTLRVPSAGTGRIP